MRSLLAQTLAALLVLVALTGPAGAAAFDNVIVFGDSLSDAGNDYIVTKHVEPASPPYHDGRFSNGPVWVEAVAAAYGIKLLPSAAGGRDYAYGGAETISDLSSSYGTIPSLYSQAQAYLKAAGGTANPKALFVIWGGSNDLLNTLDGNLADLPTLPTRFSKATKKIIDTLHAAGAKSFLVPQLPDVGLSPLGLSLGSELSGLVSDTAKAMNTALAVVLLDEKMEGVTIYHLQDFTLQDRLATAATVESIAKQPYFNLTNVTTPCLDGTKICADQYQYFYWDSLHPTAAVHALLATAALTVLPQ